MRQRRRKSCIEDNVREFDVVVGDVSLPTLDRLMYRNNLIGENSDRVKEEGNDARLTKLIKLLRDHKSRTMRVLVAIQDRETVLNKVFELISLFEKLSTTLVIEEDDGKTSVSIRTKALRYIYLLQTVTITVLDAIKHWRAMLTRPFAFVFNQQNYIIKIVRDCRFIEQSALTDHLPLKLCSYPLCSNVPSLTLFQCSEQNGISKKVPQAATPVFLQRLKKLEQYVASEFASQSSLLHELIDLCVSGYFVPLLNTSLVPNCSKGVPINSQRWALRQAVALRTCYENLTKPPDDESERLLAINSPDANPVDGDENDNLMQLLNNHTVLKADEYHNNNDDSNNSSDYTDSCST